MDRANEVWLATNLLRGTPRDAVREALAARGFSEADIDAALRACESSPLFEAAGPFVDDARRLQMLSRRSDALLRSVPAARHVAEMPAEQWGSSCEGVEGNTQAQAFFRDFVAEGIPVVLKDAARALPAFERWDWESLRREHGRAVVRPTRKRPFDPAARSVNSPLEALSLDDLIAHVLSHRSTLDDPGYYLVAAEPALRGGLTALRPDIPRDPRVFAEDPDGAATHLWLGPAGTRTEFHHDQDHIVAFQIRGKMRFRLVPPLDPVLMQGAVSTFNELHWDHPAVEDAFVRVVDLGEGDALFIPVGYWHAVLALTPSITLSLTRLRTGAPPRFRLDGRT